MSRIRIRPIGNGAAECEPIVLREKDTVRLVFKPTLVQNKQEASMPICGAFIYQKKRKADEWGEQWDDETGAVINRIEPGTGLKLALDAEETNKLLQSLAALYGFFEKNGLPQRQQDIFVSGNEAAIRGNVAKLVEQIASDNGVDSLTACLEWIAGTHDPRKIVGELTRLQADSRQKINTIAGVSALKKAVELWQANKESAKEAFWQKMFGEMPFVLSQLYSAPVVFLEGNAYVGGTKFARDGGKLVDYLLASEKTDNMLIVELKHSRTALLSSSEYRSGVYGPSGELASAVVQVAYYKDRVLKDYFRSKVDNEHLRFRAVNPHCLLVVGDTAEFGGDSKKIESFEMFRNNLKDCSVVTFDELFRKTEVLIELLESPPVEEDYPF